MERNLLKPFLTALGVVVISALILSWAYDRVSAATQQDIYQSHSNGNDTRDAYPRGQSFKPTASNINAFSFWATPNAPYTGSTTIVWRLCKGTPSFSDWNTASWNCAGAGQELVLGGSTEFAITYSASAQEYTINLPITKWVTPGAQYYFSVYNLDARFSWRYSDTPNPDYYSDGKYYSQGLSAANRDFQFRTFYDDGFVGSPVSDPIVGVMPDADFMSLSYAALQFKNNYYCLASSTAPCVVDFRFNSYAEGSLSWFYYSSSLVDGVPTGTRLATTSIVANSFDTATATIPYDATYYDKQTTYCALLHDPELIDDDRLFCNWHISWLGDQSMAYLRAKAGLTKFDITQACSSMDSSASTTFAYGIECGLRKVAYWSFTPSYDTQLDFLNSSQNLKDQFPMSIYYQVKDNMMLLSQEIASSSSSTEFSVPLLVYGLNTNMTLFSEHMVADKLGQAWTDFNRVASYFIYFITFLYFVKEIFRVAEKNTHDH